MVKMEEDYDSDEGCLRSCSRTVPASSSPGACGFEPGYGIRCSSRIAEQQEASRADRNGGDAVATSSVEDRPTGGVTSPSGGSGGVAVGGNSPLSGLKPSFAAAALGATAGAAAAGGAGRGNSSLGGLKSSFGAAAGGAAAGAAGAAGLGVGVGVGGGNSPLGGLKPSFGAGAALGMGGVVGVGGAGGGGGGGGANSPFGGLKPSFATPLFSSFGTSTAMEEERVSRLPDVWSRRFVNFQSLADGLQALQSPVLLEPFFRRWAEVTTAIEVSCSGLDTVLAREVIRSRKITVLLYGETGAGKTTLLRAISGEDTLKVSATGPGTTREVVVRLPCGIRMVDTPGFRVPLVLGKPRPANTQGNDYVGLSLQWVREFISWKTMLRELASRLGSQDPEHRPFALIYCHRTGHRIIRERIIEILRLPHQRLVPVFVVLTDVCNADDRDISSIRKEWQSILDEVGPNAKGAKVQIVEVNSHPKTVQGHTHWRSGICSLISALLNALDPLDAITFIRNRGFFSNPSSSSRKRARRALPERELEDEDGCEEDAANGLIKGLATNEDTDTADD